jgi:ribosome recycling factor
MTDTRLNDLGKRMDSAFEILVREFTGLRTGRASVNLLDTIKVDVYGSLMPLNQIGTINVPEPRLLTVQVWDKNMVKVVEKAIRDSDLGLNPSSDGQVIRIPLPPMSEQRRQELVKIAGKYAEDTRISVRNVRRDGMEMLKKWEKDGDISEDDLHRLSGEVQTITDNHIKKIDDLLATKQKDIMQV